MLMLKRNRGIIPNLQPQPHNTSPKSWWNNAHYCILPVCIAILVYLIPYDSKDKSHKTLCIPDLPYQYGYSYLGDFAVSHEREGAEMTPIVKYVDSVLNYPYSDPTQMAIMKKFVEDLVSNYPYSDQTLIAIMKKYVEDLISHYPYSDQTRIPIMKKYIDDLVSNYTYSDQIRTAIMKKYVEYVENLVSNYPYSDQTQMAIISKYFEDIVSNYPYRNRTQGSDPVACTSSHDSESTSISKDILLPADRSESTLNVLAQSN